MIKKSTYILTVIPFRVLEKDSKKATVISDKGKYYSIKSSCIPNFNKGDIFYKSTLIGDGIVQTNYFKTTKKERRKQPFVNFLEEILTKLGEN